MIGNFWYVLYRDDPSEPWELWTGLTKDQAREVERRYRSEKQLVVIGFGRVH